MSVHHFNKEQEKRINMNNNILKFDGGNSVPNNWLLAKPVGAKFVVCSNDVNNYMCLELELVSKTDKTATLFESSTGQPFGGATGRQEANRFINKFRFVEDIEVYEEMLEQKLEQLQEQEDPEKYVR